MKSIEFFLDAILTQLQKDREVPVSQHNHLNADIVLREIIKTDRHEDYQEIIDLLREDGMIKRVNEKENMTELDKSKDVLITIKGSLFIQAGGYTAKTINDAKTESRKESYERKLLYGTWAVAIGAIALVAWEIDRKSVV